MADSGMELEHVRQVIREARQVRQAAAAQIGAPSSGPDVYPGLLPRLLKSLSDLIDASESLAAERESMESRLHRTPFLPDGTDFASPGERR